MLDLPGPVTPRSCPQLLCKLDIEEAELRFVQTHGAGRLGVGVRIYEIMRVGESGVGRISRLGEPGYQSSQLYRMGRYCCIYTRSIISTREKKSKQKDVDMKLNVMYKTGYQLGVKNAHLQFPHTRANHNFDPVPVQAPYVWCPSRSIAYDAGVLAKQTKRGVWWFGSSRKC